ncbi:hypothetical protein QBC41DRAFT_328646 [Cercophora samala]|uniref:Copper acquisition factor BIM1-like domain-containing protein n=1 Tax=Cercophora samala TaxID=330535 RepID=A0AA39Z5E2_9PEZI|nr:hypothetical protein QBC41DRAFT_328646 [Cercophora samala]
MLTSTFLTALTTAAVASAHIVITYPGWRGNNLKTNKEFPYGMQWMYPCGGMEVTTNRTYWSTKGGAIAFQPGWFQGHATAMVYVNMGFGTEGPEDGPPGGPPNMSFPMVPPFQLLGPSKNPYPGTVCLPQVPLPVNATVKAGDNATIQVVELAIHGAALYSCVDITFVDPGDERLTEVNETNCFNSTDIGVADVYTLTLRASGQGAVNLTSDATRSLSISGSTLAWIGYVPLALGGLWALL